MGIGLTEIVAANTGSRLLASKGTLRSSRQQSNCSAPRDGIPPDGFPHCRSRRYRGVLSLKAHGFFCNKQRVQRKWGQSRNRSTRRRTGSGWRGQAHALLHPLHVGCLI